jgi:hypothetical protein
MAHKHKRDFYQNKPRMELSIDDFLDNGRCAYSLPFSEGRTELSILANSSLVLEWDELSHVFSKYGISFIDHAANYPAYSEKKGDYVDCRDWAFEALSLQKYMFKYGKCCADKLLKEDVPELSWIPEPEHGALALYFNFTENDRVLGLGGKVQHWGVVAGINGHIMIKSKWGMGHVFEHPAESVPTNYGGFLYFFRKTV